MNDVPLSRATRTRLAIALSLLTVVAPGCGSHGQAPAAAASAEARVATVSSSAVAEARAVSDTLSLTGTLLADEDSQVTPVTPGRVVEVLVERGDRVEEGQPLVRLRDTDYRLQSQSAAAQVAQARARLGMTDGARPPAPEDTAEARSARSALELADETLRRAESLAERGVYTPQQLDEARSRAVQAREQYTTALQSVRASTAALAAAQAQLSIASTSLRESLVRAPFAGEIAVRNVSPGEFVSAQTALVTLVRTNPLRLELQIPQERVGDVHAGQRVEIRVDAFPETPFVGTVRYVSAAVDRQSRALVVEAVVPNDDGRLRPGMFATARLDLGRQLQVAVVPAGAISTNAGVHRAFVVRDGHIEEHVVSLLDSEPTEAIIASGIEPGMTVATSDLDQLADGMAVAGAAAAAAPAPQASANGS